MPDGQLHVGIVVPESGPSGIFGPSCIASAELAIDEINVHGGILGREVVGTVIDGGGANPRSVAARVRHEADHHGLDALIGWHTSALRREIVRAVGGRIPYFYTALYEGGESSDGVFTTGEVPEVQVCPSLRWMSAERGAKSWFVVGSDYVWPRSTLAFIKARAGRDGPFAKYEIRIDDAAFAPLGTTDFQVVLDSIEQSTAEGVLLLLLGQDAVTFNRQFADRGLHRDFLRLSPLMDENMLMAGGPETSENLFSVSGFFETLATGHSLDYGARYARRFGITAPALTSPGESCYEGVSLFAGLSEKAGSVGVSELSKQAQSVLEYDSPRGHVRFERHHLAQDVYLAQADGLAFDVVAQVATSC